MIVRVAHHALAIVDKIVYDTRDSSKSRIRNVWIRKQHNMPSDWPKLTSLPPVKKVQARGEKRQQLLDLIRSGITEPSVLSRRLNVSYVYARSVVI